MTHCHNVRLNVACKHVTPFTFAFEHLCKPRASQRYGHSVVKYCFYYWIIISFHIQSNIITKEGCSWLWVSGYRDTQLLSVKGACKQPESDRNHWKPMSWLHDACNSRHWYKSREGQNIFDEYVFALPSLPLSSSPACSPLTSAGIYRVNYFWVFFLQKPVSLSTACIQPNTRTHVWFQKTG